MKDNDQQLIYEAYINEGMTPTPPGGWRVKPEMEKWLEEKYHEIYDNWVPIKQTLLRGDVPIDFVVFQGKPNERKMTLMDIVPSRKGEPKTLVDWIRGQIKLVIVTAGNWVDNDVRTNSRLIFDPPASIDDYSEALREFRIGLVGFGNKPRTVWHMIDSQNVRRMAPNIQDGIDELFELTREIIHYNREQTSEDKPNPTDQSPSDDPNQGMY